MGNVEWYYTDLLQHEAATIATGWMKLESLVKLYPSVGKIHKLILFYKMLSNKIPEYLFSLVPN